MEAIQNKTTNKIVGIKNAGWVIICCFIIAICIYNFLLGNPANFMNNDPNNHPLPGNFLGTIYKGGYCGSYYSNLVAHCHSIEY